jgi:drug/metabolite transporter (DMT)-like permease
MGMFLCFISSMLLALGTLMVSRMTQFHPITKSFWRFVGTFIPSIFVVIYYAFKKEPITDSFWPLRYESFKVFISLVVSY